MAEVAQEPPEPGRDAAARIVAGHHGVLVADPGFAEGRYTDKVLTVHSNAPDQALAQLDKLPPQGFYLFVAPIKIETGSGGPTDRCDGPRKRPSTIRSSLM